MPETPSVSAIRIVILCPIDLMLMDDLFYVLLVVTVFLFLVEATLLCVQPFRA
jgi:hypothetical protein